MNYLIKSLSIFRLLLVIGLGAFTPFYGKANPGATTSVATQMAGKLQAAQLLFTENRGQVTDAAGKARPDILFTAHSGGTSVYLTANAIHYQFTKINHSSSNTPGDGYAARHGQAQAQTCRFSVTLAGANPHPTVRREGKNTFTQNFYLPQCPNGIAGVAAYEKLVYEEVYPHIDWVLYSTAGHLKYDFIVHPGGDPAQIKLQVQDADKVSITTAGELLMQTRLGEVREKAPESYAGDNKVPTRFVQDSNGAIGFAVAPQPGQDLRIDPAILWSTYFGGSGLESGYSCGIDSAGNVYISAGASGTAGLATSGAFQAGINGNEDAFFAKFSAAGVLLWATYFGGSNIESPEGFHVDGPGNVYISGFTQSTDLPVTAGAYQTMLVNITNGYLAKFSTTGARQWATYYGGTSGGTNYAEAGSCTTDDSGNVYMAGTTTFTSGIATTGAYQVAHSGTSSSADLFLVKFNPLGARQWATYYGGTSTEASAKCITDAAGNVFLAGQTQSTSGIASTGAYKTILGGTLDVFLAKFNSSGVRQWGTYFGGNGNETAPEADEYLTIDLSGNVYMTGKTTSTSGIATTGAYQSTYGGGSSDVFLAKFSNAGTPLWCTYYGGMGSDNSTACVTDVSRNVYLVGTTSSTSGIYYNGFQSIPTGTAASFAAKFDSAGAITWGSYFGGDSTTSILGAAVDTAGNLYVTGATNSANGIATAGAHQITYGGGYDAFLTKIEDLDIFTGAIAGSPFCPGTAVSVPFTKNGLLNAGNVFTAQLSDSSGSFANPVNMGTLNDTASSGVIAATIPATAIPGIHYRIRVVSASPVDAGRDNGTDLVVKTGCCVPMYDTVTNSICASQLPYSWNGKTITGGGIAVAVDTLSNIHGCDSIVTLNLTIKTPAGQPAAFIASTTTVCQGQSNVIYKVPNDTDVTYTWSYSGTGIVIIGTADSVSVHFSDTATSGTISVTATGTCGISLPRTLVITVTAIPVVAIAGSRAICTNGSTALIASGATTYSWSPSTTLSSATGDSVQASPTATTTYTVTGTTGNCVDTVTATVAVNALPKDTLTVYAPGVVCAGSTLLLQTTIDTGYRYQWQKDGIDITGATSAFYSATVAGSYDVRITVGVGCTITTHQVAVSTAAAPMPVITNTGNGQFCVTGFATYQWYVNGTAIAGDTTACITPATSGSYTVTVTNTAGCSATSNAVTTGISNVTPEQVKLYPNPATNIVNITAPQRVNASLCSIDGRELMYVADAKTISISALPNAVYLVKIYDQDNNLVKVEKLVKAGF